LRDAAPAVADRPLIAVRTEFAISPQLLACGA
jgi:hypothetical protein